MLIKDIFSVLAKSQIIPPPYYGGEYDYYDIALATLESNGIYPNIIVSPSGEAENVRSDASRDIRHLLSLLSYGNGDYARGLDIETAIYDSSLKLEIPNGDSIVSTLIDFGSLRKGGFKAWVEEAGLEIDDERFDKAIRLFVGRSEKDYSPKSGYGMLLYILEEDADRKLADFRDEGILSEEEYSKGILDIRI